MHGWHRAVCALLIVALVPAQFLPVVVAAVGKSRERRAVAAAVETLAAWPRTCGLVAARPPRSRSHDAAAEWPSPASAWSPRSG